ncbi:calcium/sodium antiporter [Mycolicibacterium diernhoferi]|uniref:Sodium:calcium antiporter n=1 Tax=Mycolicibacterium diernhoferi TaxID=1801 RepID=A0A1Q4HEC7_9MYCO|nr:calcium/sodium antiporter [Mycolicibacterium diernhoferi]OJZ65904.1 sodium:calcium antiporter [Mycolicibacterium diernhoferi]OPE53653.1 sodium:calcium antiporter [Mycolicibacterium diernhoferi]PEG53280.1 sodium:calcium antiporter [Mycolicibacterium diernhoferi]QYL23810.1 calcium/sodium antiporter [Mycolicibacterium diernhoferi]
MMIDAAWFLAGLVALIFGAEIMVRGGAEVAARLGISPIVIGLTVVSIGTSLPELAVGVVAVQEGSGALAVGNIAGTNVVNLLLILGLSALIVPLAMAGRTLRFELPVMAGAAVLMLVLSLDGKLTQTDGLILVAGAVAYTVALIRATRRETAAVVHEYDEEYPPEVGTVRTRTPLHVAMMIGGIAVVVIGADWLVDGAVGMARSFGISDALIGLTVVAIGTSAPELVTTVVSTIRGNRDIAIGNLLGSSIYNILLILGATCLVASEGLALPASLVRIDIPVMVAVALVCIPIFVSGRRVSRGEGGAMVGAYLAYLAFLLITQS